MITVCHHNDDKLVDIENEVESDNAPENNVGGVYRELQVSRGI